MHKERSGTAKPTRDILSTDQPARYAKVREATGLSAYKFAIELMKKDVIKAIDHYYKIERGDISNVSIDIENGIIQTAADLTDRSFNDVLLDLRGVPS